MRPMTVAIGSFLCLALIGCDEPVRVGAPPSAAPPRPRAGAAVADAGVDGAVDAGPTAIGYRESDFVELGVVNRDPFRDFVVSVIGDSPVINPREVKLRNVALDQMRLIAVITGVPVPYAMVEDPEGVGHVISRGDYIGREDVVNSGGAEGMPIALNWRVDRIRDGEVVLTRDDPLHPDQPPLMRSMALRDRASDGTTQQGARSGVLSNTGSSTSGAGAPAPTPGVLVAPPTPPRTPPTPSRGDDSSSGGGAPRPPASAGSSGGSGGSNAPPARAPSIFGQGFSP